MSAVSSAPLGALPANIVARYAAAVPRYTSYPSAAHFAALGEDTHRAWIKALPPGDAVSIYLHVPYCAALCWYCGCNTQATVHHRERIAAYIDVLLAEIDDVASLLGRRQVVSSIHFGGGTPNLMAQTELDRVMSCLEARFAIAPDAEVAMEIDPRHLTAEFALALGAQGFNRASLGVQDFDPLVQEHIHRVQPYAGVEQAASWLRDAGIAKLSLDLIYGLPAQTVDSVRRTAQLALGLKPDRIALYGYAHLPSRQRHQRMIDPTVLPTSRDREAMQRNARRDLVAGGMVAVGMDHFARPGDPLLSHCIRNFQGYRSDRATTLLGFGASAISRFREGHAQNVSETPAWRERIEQGRLATERGVAMDDDDRMRADVIESLMCSFEAPLDAIASRHNRPRESVVADVALLDSMVADGLAWQLDGRVGCSGAGRPLVRTLCAAFDRRVVASARHAPPI